METTCDGLLNRRVMIEQPVTGFRVAVDTVMLAAAVPAVAGERALDIGCGAGGALLCLGARVPGVQLAGIEIQAELAALCRANLKRQSPDATAEIITADATQFFDNPAHASWRQAFDHVLINPPYHDTARHDVSLVQSKRIANAGSDDAFGSWIATAAQALKPGGSLTIIHRADRLAGLLNDLAAGFGGMEILPLISKTGAAAKRIILRARKGSTAPQRQLPDFILHKPEGGYTDAAEAILRHAQALAFAIE